MGEIRADMPSHARGEDETRRINRQRRGHLLDFLFFGALFAASIWLTINRSAFAIPLWLSLALVIGVWAIAFTRQYRRFTRMNCPNCAGSLSRKRTTDDEPILFPCDQCLIIWDTGFSESSDAGG